MTRSVLIIDNDESLVDLLAFIFEDKGYTVYRAYDGDVGIELALRHRPQAIICDMIMSQMHGFEVLQELRRHPALAGTVVVAMSAKAYKGDIDRARELGATDYVVKPFRMEELYSVVERHVSAQATPPRPA
jgi:DNA-binding response OmpR family regulator